MRVPYPHPRVAREGWPMLAAVAGAALAVALLVGWTWSLPLWAAAAFVLQFFRDPPREAPDDPRAVLAPADGRVIAVGPARDPFLERDALRISVFMNVFNVHANRAPVDGRVMKRWYRPGAFLNAALDKAAEANERNALWIRTPRGEDVVCVQIAGLVARRIHCYCDEGSELVRGQRYGFIRFGSRVDLYLPPQARPLAALGDRVYACATMIARFPDGG